jgi:CheY-like chemotaxis protein
MPPSAPTALLVSRDQLLRDSCAAVLRNLGYAVEATDDGRVAFAMAMKRRPSAAVLALSHEWEGLELCDLLRTDALTSTLPLVVVLADPGREQDARSVGVQGVLVHPAGQDEWRRTLQDAAAAPTTPAVPKTPAVQTKRRRAAANTTERSLTPPTPPPTLHCPRCDNLLTYRYSHVGGAERREQWDRFSCTACGDYCYRPRTRRLSPISSSDR